MFGEEGGVATDSSCTNYTLVADVVGGECWCGRGVFGGDGGG